MSNARLQGNASGTGTVTLESPNTNSDLTISMPARAGNMAVDGPAFRASYTTTTSLSNSVWTKVTLDNETFDTNSNFASSRFTPTVAGYYQINAGVETTNTTTTTLVAIYKNGLNYASASSGFQSATIDATAAVSDLVYLNGSTDYVEMYAIQISGSTQTVVGSSVTHLSGSLVRAT